MKHVRHGCLVFRYGPRKRKQHICIYIYAPNVRTVSNQPSLKNIRQALPVVDQFRLSCKIKNACESYQKSFSISHISPHFEKLPLTTCPMLHHITIYMYIYIRYHYNEQILKATFSFPPNPPWKCQESQKDLPLLSRTHFLCMATTAKMALLQVK